MVGTGLAKQSLPIIAQKVRFWLKKTMVVQIVLFLFYFFLVKKKIKDKLEPLFMIHSTMLAHFY